MLGVGALLNRRSPSADSRADESANVSHSSPTNASARASRFSHMKVLVIEGHLARHERDDV
jgi:hypothetical protein